MNEETVEEKYSILFSAIHSLFDEKIESKNEAHEFIIQWQNSENSIFDCLEILSSTNDHHILFVIIKIIQNSIRFSREKLIEHDLFTVILKHLLELLMKEDLPSLHRDFVLISICDISNQTGALDESIIDSIPQHLILRFFAFFFDNWHESFVTHLIQPNFVEFSFQLFEQFDIDINWLRIFKAISNEMNDFSLFLPFCSKILLFDPQTNEDQNCIIDIISILCTYEFATCELFLAYLEFLMKMSIKLSSVYLCISFFGMRSDYFMDIPDDIMNEIMNEIFRVFSNFLEFPDQLSIIDLISLSYYFFHEYNNENMINYQLTYLNLLVSIINSMIIDDNEIRSILSNLHELRAYELFVNSVELSLPFCVLISYNAEYFPLDKLSEISVFLMEHDFNEQNSYLLSFIRQTYFLLDDHFHQIFLLKLNDLFPSDPNRCSKILYFIVSKDLEVSEEFFDIFSKYLGINSVFIIPSLLFLLKHEDMEFYSEIIMKLRFMIESVDIYQFLFNIRSMISKFPSIIHFPFHATFYYSFSCEVITFLENLYFTVDDDQIKDEITFIVSTLIMQKYIEDPSIFQPFFNSLMS